MYPTLRHFFAAVAALIVPLALAVPGCAGDDSAGGGGSSGSGGSGGGTGGGGTGGTSGGTGLCILNNCNSDAECDGCSFGRTTCNVAEHRCIACDATTGQGCPPGEECTSFGTCAPVGSTCPTDGQGNPTNPCATSADCVACDPKHQICDPATKKCVGCTETNTSMCAQADICVDGKCSHKCPDSCTIDNDCARCVYTDGASIGKAAKACFNHKCAECSDTYACPLGKVCQKGQCVQPCGIVGQPTGTCNGDADCGGCGDQDPVTPAWKCKYAINGGNHGTCTAPAAGCEDLGNGAVLPAPWDTVTQLCSNDGNCAGIGIQYNVGQLIRDLLGAPEIDIGIKKIAIQDANVSYGMNVCASIELLDNISCGVCVPCKVDSDCKKISIDQLVVDLFKGDPMAQTAFSLLVDLLYGSNEDHSLHFQCLEVAGGYGVCAPCSNPTKACGNTGGGGTGTCDHDVCATGGPLKDSCGTCAAEVCKNDSFCCTSSWDSVCVSEVEKYCPGGCSGGGTTTCDHDPCTTGKALSKTCSSCVDSVCTADPYCCSTNWDQQCVDEAAADTACSGSCGGGCAHDECTSGGPLSKTCSTCATDVCNADPYCCNNQWDSMCVDEAKKHTSCGC